MEPVRETLRMYHQPSDAAALDWPWVEDQLTTAGTYWVVGVGGTHPHPRPVWGIWEARRLHLSIGSPVVSRLVEQDPAVTVHLDSGTDVVIVEGRVTGSADEADLVERYDTKYTWTYTVDEYGPLTTVEPSLVLAWRSDGWAGRDGFRQTGRWRF
ncbi:MAG: hypothetical protein ACR2QE_12175 [Acidimicrobiales bacterium]